MDQSPITKKQPNTLYLGKGRMMDSSGVIIPEVYRSQTSILRTLELSGHINREAIDWSA